MGKWFESTATRQTATFQCNRANADPEDGCPLPSANFIATSERLYARAARVAKASANDPNGRPLHAWFAVGRDCEDFDGNAAHGPIMI